MKKSIVVAVTGGIGTGKSTVAKYIRESGYPVISSDDNAKTIMVENKDVKSKIIDYFGNESYNEDGTVNSKFMAKKVFSGDKQSEENLKKLNSIVHPVVIQKLIDGVDELERLGEKLIFVESALTFEANLEDGFDFIIVVDCDEDIAIKRVMERSNLSEDEIKSRMSQQISNQYKKEMSDFVLENNGTVDDLKKSTDMILKILEASTD